MIDFCFVGKFLFTLVEIFNICWTKKMFFIFLTQKWPNLGHYKWHDHGRTFFKLKNGQVFGIFWTLFELTKKNVQEMAIFWSFDIWNVGIFHQGTILDNYQNFLHPKTNHNWKSHIYTQKLWKKNHKIFS